MRRGEQLKLSCTLFGCETCLSPPKVSGMTASFHPSDTHPFVRKVESIALSALSDDVRRALLALPMQVVRFGAYEDIVREGDRPSRCFLCWTGSSPSTSQHMRASARSWPTTWLAMYLTSRAST